MINMNYMRAIKTDVKAEAKVEKNNALVEKSSKSFKEHLEDKSKVVSNEKPKVNIEEPKKKDPEPKEVITEVSKKIESLVEKLESNADDEAIKEELVGLLALLNINITDETALPIEISLDGIEDIITSNINLNPVESISLDSTKMNIVDEKNVNDISITLKDIITEIVDSDNAFIESDFIEKLEKNIDKLLPFIKGEGDKNVLKENIISAIKSKVNLKHEDTVISDIEITQEVNQADTKEVSKATIPTMIVREEKQTNSEDKLNVVDSKETEEDKVLSKLLADDGKSFSNIMSRLEAKNSSFNVNNSEGTPVFKETMDKDIIKNVKFMIRNAVQELKVKIYPKELGELTIKILSEEGIMKAEIKATSKETYNLLNSNMNEIKKALSNENIKIQDVNIGLYGEDTTYFSGQGFQGKANDNKKQGSNSAMVINNEGEEIIEEANNDSNVDLLA